MKAFFAVGAALLWAIGHAPAQAESVRCNGTTTAIGDSKLSVMHACGTPLLADAFCEPIYIAGSPSPLPTPIGSAFVGCQPVEDWLYDRGAGMLMATVRFKNGKVQSIRYGQTPR